MAYRLLSCNLTMDRQAEETIGHEPDTSWRWVDANAHTHEWVGDVIPTLELIVCEEEPTYCPECDHEIYPEGWFASYYRCKECGDVLEGRPGLIEVRKLHGGLIETSFALLIEPIPDTDEVKLPTFIGPTIPWRHWPILLELEEDVCSFPREWDGATFLKGINPVYPNRWELEGVFKGKVTVDEPPVL